MNPFIDAQGRPIPPMPLGTAKPHRAHLVATPTYFFKKSKGRFIAVDADTAWRLFNDQNQMIGSKLTRIQLEKWEYVGRTDGKSFVKKVEEAHKLLAAGDMDGFQEAIKKAEFEEYKKASKDKTLPPNRDVINTSGMANSQIMI